MLSARVILLNLILWVGYRVIELIAVVRLVYELLLLPTQLIDHLYKTRKE